MGDIGDHPAQDRIAEVGIIVPHFRRLCERHSGGEQFGEVVLRQRRLAVAPRVIGYETRHVVQQVADRDARRICGGIAPATHFRNVFFRRIVEAEQPFVA